jgi:hypothetical protein
MTIGGGGEPQRVERNPSSDVLFQLLAMLLSRIGSRYDAIPAGGASQGSYLPVIANES